MNLDSKYVDLLYQKLQSDRFFIINSDRSLI
jgi:hypothetical protein